MNNIELTPKISNRYINGNIDISIDNAVIIKLIDVHKGINLDNVAKLILKTISSDIIKQNNEQNDI